MRRITISDKIKAVETLNKTVENTDEAIGNAIQDAQLGLDRARALLEIRRRQTKTRSEAVDDLQFKEFPDELKIESEPFVPELTTPPFTTTRAAES